MLMNCLIMKEVEVDVVSKPNMSSLQSPTLRSNVREKTVFPEVDAYLHLLVLVFLIDGGKLGKVPECAGELSCSYQFGIPYKLSPPQQCQQVLIYLIHCR